MHRIFANIMLRTPFFSLGIALAIFVADLASKFWIQSHLPNMSYYYPYGGIPVFENFLGVEFSIVHAINRGAAWGLFSDFQLPLVAIRIALIASLILYALFFNKNKHWEIPLLMVAAGALGNILDYFLYGHVIDMLHFVLWGYSFPVFNIADSAICLGIFSLVLMSMFEKTAVVTEK